MREDYPYLGRQVFYRLEYGPYTGSYRPAIIVRVWNRGEPNSPCNLQVFIDGTNDGVADSPTIWVTSRLHGTHNAQFLYEDEYDELEENE